MIARPDPFIAPAGLPTAELRVVTDAYVLARYASDTAPLPEADVVGRAVADIRKALQKAEEG